MIHLHSSLYLTQTKIEIDSSITYTYNGTEVYLSKANGSMRFMVDKISYNLIGKASAIHQVTSKINVNLKKVEDEE
jgi:hypothetical protein